MGRPRHPRRRNWPAGLTPRLDKRTGRTFYTYRGPAAKKEVYLGFDLDAAKRGVAIINGKRAVEPVQRVLAAIEQPRESMADHIDWYDREVLSKQTDKRGRPLSETTLYEARRMLKVIRKRFGPGDVMAPDQRAVSVFLEAFPARASNQYRSRLMQLFARARARGLRADNPVEGTMERPEVIARQRLSKAVYDAIHAAAPAWLQRAMDLALYSLQRREDLTLMTAGDWAGGKLKVLQGKTGMRLRITPGKRLKAAIIACLNSTERDDCPYLVHREPVKERQAKGRTHVRQLAPEHLSRAFAELRDALPAMATVDAAARPTWHEIRALGADLYRQEKWDEAEIQALLGHVAEGSSAMTRHYLDGHGERWNEVSAR